MSVPPDDPPEHHQPKRWGPGRLGRQLVFQLGGAMFQLGRTTRLLLAMALGTAIILLLPKPPGVWGLALYGTWALILGVAMIWQIHKVVAINRHLMGAQIGLRAPRAPDAYLKALFGAYARRYDQHMFEDLAYSGPNIVRDLVADRLEDRAGRLVIVDLGCGTGVCGPLFRRIAARLIGVDLSPEMLAQARARRVYDDLEADEISRFLQAHRGSFDLLIAADVLVYVGDLRPVLAAAGQALRPGGLFVFTVEAAAGDDFVLHSNGRYAHPRDYVERTATAAGLTPVEVRAVSVRTERDQPVASDAWLLQRPEDAADQAIPSADL